MAYEFNWLLDYPATLKRAPKVLEATFGDGYVQRAGDGINSVLETWTIKASGVPVEIAKEIDDFLFARGGWELFQWRAPTPTAIVKNYVCKQWDVSYTDEDEANISATFIEDVIAAVTTTTPAP